MSSASLIALTSAPLEAPSGASAQQEVGGAARLRSLVDAHHAFVWRSLRRLGVPHGEVDDAVQKVFLTVSRRLADVDRGSEKQFLFATAFRIASNERRAEGRRRHSDISELDQAPSSARSPENRAADRVLLDRLLESLPLDLRSIFVLFELEQMTREEIASLLDLPPGTVASRLKRARELVEETIRRMRARNGEDL